MKTLARLIRSARGDLSRAATARRLGCSYSHLYGLEAGMVLPSLDFAEALAKEFDDPRIAAMVIESEIETLKKKLGLLEKRLRGWKK